MSAVRSAEAPNAPVSDAANIEPIHLENGELADQPTFHAWYKTTPEGFKAELIDGGVVVSSPVSGRHGFPSNLVNGLLYSYIVATPGVRAADNTTLILSERSELQPDCALLIRPDWGGQSRFDDEGYIVGPPELVVEVANSSRAIDMHRKKEDYERAGVREYAVVLIRDRKLRWFANRDGKFEEVEAVGDGVHRSTVFPGLWVQGDALIGEDYARLDATLKAGLASPEHAEFVRLMESRRPQAKE